MRPLPERESPALARGAPERFLNNNAADTTEADEERQSARIREWIRRWRARRAVRRDQATGLLVDGAPR